MKKTRYPGIKMLDKNTYRVRVKRIDPRTGKRKEVQRTINGTLDDALAEKLAIVAEIESGQLAVERQTVEDYATAWFERNQARWQYSTETRHAEHLDLLIDDLGDWYVDQCFPKDVRQWRDGLVDSGYSHVSANGSLRVARTMFRDAKADLGLAHDPCERIRELPVDTHDHEGGNVLDGEELHLLLSGLAAPWNLMAFTMATTGLRFCHVSALRWQDVDLDEGVLRPRMTQYRGVVSPISKDSRKKAPKSIPLCRELVAMLAAHRRQLVEEQHPGLAEGWVFPRPNGGVFYTGDLNPPIQAALKAAGITKRFTAHGLRRSFINVARQQADAIVVRSITGQTEEMHEHYSHVGIDEKRILVNAVVAQIRDRSGTPGGTQEPEKKKAEQ